MKVSFVENNNKKIKCEYSKRKNSKNFSMKVDNNGIVKISLPYYTTYFEAKNFVNTHIDWVEKKLDLLKLQKKRYYYLGEDITLIKKYLADNSCCNYIFSNNILITETSNDNTYSDDDLYFHWLRKRAEDYIPSKVEEFSRMYGFKYNSIKIKNLTSRWGSCSNKKNLSFNLKLMYFNYKVIDYVIVHELCHLIEMNHSQKFWNLVKQIIPNHKYYRSQLNKIIQS